MHATTNWLAKIDRFASEIRHVVMCYKPTTTNADVNTPTTLFTSEAQISTIKCRMFKVCTSCTNGIVYNLVGRTQFKIMFIHFPQRFTFSGEKSRCARCLQ